MRLRATLAAATLLALAPCLAAPSNAHANSFVVRCAATRVANDDPIVSPGMPGVAHRHEFYGAQGTAADSTPAQLRAGRTSCGDAADTAAYWAPTLEVDGHLTHATLYAYYERAGKPRAAAPPAGLQMIAGEMHAHAPQRMRVVSWSCVRRAVSTIVRNFRTVPSCARGTRLAARVHFPDCWNGSDLDSADHRSHVAYAERGRCPRSHPVAIMRVTMLLVWPVRPRSAAHVRLADGMLGATGLHADFWNTWHQSALQQLRWDCIEVARPCGEVRRRA